MSRISIRENNLRVEVRSNKFSHVWLDSLSHPTPSWGRSSTSSSLSPSSCSRSDGQQKVRSIPRGIFYPLLPPSPGKDQPNSPGTVLGFRPKSVTDEMVHAFL